MIIIPFLQCRDFLIKYDSSLPQAAIFRFFLVSNYWCLIQSKDLSILRQILIPHFFCFEIRYIFLYLFLVLIDTRKILPSNKKSTNPIIFSNFHCNLFRSLSFPHLIKECLDYLDTSKTMSIRLLFVSDFFLIIS